MTSANFWVVQGSYLPPQTHEAHRYRRNIHIYVVAETIESAIALVRAENLPELKIVGINYKGTGQWIYENEHRLIRS